MSDNEYDGGYAQHKVEDPIKRRIREEKEAKQDEIRLLIEFIGGFYKWTLLNNDCRLEVLKYLDYGSRCCLGLCSKTDQALVKNAPVRIHRLTINEASAEYDAPRVIKKSERTIEVRAELSEEYSPQNCIKRLFIQQRRDTRIIFSTSCNGSRYRKQTYLKAKNNFDEAGKYLEKCTQKYNNKVNHLRVRMAGNRFENLNIPQLNYCKSAEFVIDNVEGLSWWLQKIPAKLDKIEVYTFRNITGLRIPTELLNAPQITQASNFRIACIATFTGEQFLNLQAKSMEFSVGFHDNNITGTVINQFLKKWAKGEVQDFKDVYIRNHFYEQPHGVILNGLKSRQWDEEFRTENKEFCEHPKMRQGFGSVFYQIESFVNQYESVTLRVGHSLVIQKTGNATTEGGRTFTTYTVPEPTFAHDEN